MRSLLVLLIVGRTVGAQVAPSVPGYQEHRRLPVHTPAAALHVELLEDDRLTPASRAVVTAAYANGHQPCEERQPDVIDLCAVVAARPLRHALVRLVSGAGKELGRLTLERATAELVPLALTRRDTALAVTVDLSADAGSYSGPVVRFLNAGPAKLTWAAVVDDATGQSAELDLPTTLKTAWRVATSTTRPEILLVACRPDLDSAPATAGNVSFVVIYARLYAIDGRWHRVARRVKGFWENDGDFPARALFP